MNSISSPQGFSPHNHKVCIDEALSAAQSLCQQKSLKLTPLRKQVLALVWDSHKPLGAYSILELLAKQRSERRIAPPTVYRALEFLQQCGLVHRIASLNAYIGCCSPTKSHQSHFLICRHCDATVELADHNINSAIENSAKSAGFAVETTCVEIIGLCPNCQAQGSAP